MKKKRARIAVVREEFYQLTGDFQLALVLNQFNHYQLMARGVEEYITKENERSLLNDDDEGPIIPSNDGWFYKKGEELCEDLMFPFKKSKAMKLIQILISRGWVEVRSNPMLKWDRVKQYRLNLLKLHHDLLEIGFALPRWDTSKFKPLQPKASCKTNSNIGLFPPGGNAFPQHGNGMPQGGVQLPCPGVVNSAPRKAIPKDTPKESNKEKRIPPPLSGESDSFSPGEEEVGQLGGVCSAGAEPGVAEQAPLDYGVLNNLPDTNSPEFPGWCEAIRKYDLAGAQRLATVFGGADSPLTLPQVARKLYKRRQSGLRGSQIELLARYYRKSRYEGLVKPAWKVKALHELLSPALIPDAVAACVEQAQERIEDLDRFISFFYDIDHVLQMMIIGGNLVTCGPGKLVCHLSERCDVPAALFLQAAFKNRTDLPEAVAGCRDRIINDLIWHREYLTIAKAMKLDLVATLGITEEEILAKQREYINKLNSEREDIVKLLGAL